MSIRDKIAFLSLFCIAAALISMPVAAASPWQVNGPHYNLNIIGSKSLDKQVGASDGHTMFVKLSGMTKIAMTQSPNGSFYVTDRNGLDGSASFAIAPGHYNVYARALGKPGGKTNISATGNFTDALDEYSLLPLGYVDISRSVGKSKPLNINDLLYVDVTLCTSVNATTGTCNQTTTYEDTWVFDVPELLEYYWNYTNDGLKLLQVRFYGCTLDPTGTVSDYCRWGDGTPISSSKTVVDF